MRQPDSFSSRYWQDVSSHFFGGESDIASRQLRFISVPSFFPESSVAVTVQGDNLNVETAIAGESIWMAGRFGAVGTHVSEQRRVPYVDVSRSGAVLPVRTAVSCVWRKLLSETRRDDAPSAGADGRAYYFYDGAKCGLVWEPRGDTEVRDFVNLAGKLARFARQPPETQPVVAEEIRSDSQVLWERIAGVGATCE